MSIGTFGNIYSDELITAWEIIDAIIHEWHESAVAMASPELADAFSAETDEVPLKSPSTQSPV
ncbi:hypothetical protein [Nostoc sp. ChiQUE01b]|uniref:hypothetical protein n=1 Tax=Nostoc sp. ChiQUE01b TaxID=3075376 RepID=UPI002AD26F88|nr:hypothetical protein [Nostoc sp. ChiQUE01b]MDZ8260959.1 hypothetical protein [Nostoc sp. ChiQUE01b]